MRRTIFAAVPLTLLALAAPAAASGGKHATTYKAKLAPIAAAPEVVASRHGEDAAGSLRGKAKLVDGARRDKVQVHVRGLTAGESYSWSVREAAPTAESANGEPAGEAGACAGEQVAAFEYSSLVARRHGQSKARARSKAFSAEDGAAYVIVVTAADGTDVACGEFEGRASRKQAKAQRKAERRAAERKSGKKGGKGDDDESSDDGESSDEDEDEAGDDESADDDESSDEDESDES